MKRRMVTDAREHTKWYGWTLDKKSAEEFRGYLIEKGIQFEPSECYSGVHFECKMTECELYFATQWFKRCGLMV